MAKTPGKPPEETGVAPRGRKAAPAAKAKSASGRRKPKVDPQSEAVYREHKEAIDRALRLCTGHLRQLGGTEVALEATRRLKLYPIRHCVEAGEGLKFG